MGFTGNNATAKMAIMSNGSCTFFLYLYNKGELGNNTMFQLAVPKIDHALKSIEKIKSFEIKYEPIREEHWEKLSICEGLLVRCGMSPN